MLDTHAVARSLTDADFTTDQADAITDAVRQAAEHGDHVTPDQFNTAVAAIETDQARLDGRLAAIEAGQARLDGRLAAIEAGQTRLDSRLDALTWRFAGAMAAQTLAIIGAVVALMRMFPAN